MGLRRVDLLQLALRLRAGCLSESLHLGALRDRDHFRLQRFAAQRFIAGPRGARLRGGELLGHGSLLRGEIGVILREGRRSTEQEKREQDSSHGDLHFGMHWRATSSSLLPTK